MEKRLENISKPTSKPTLKAHISTLASSLANRDAKLVLMDDLCLAEASDISCEAGLIPYRLGIPKMQVMLHMKLERAIPGIIRAYCVMSS